jgi:hypothetical protein
MPDKKTSVMIFAVSSSCYSLLYVRQILLKKVILPQGLIGGQNHFFYFYRGKGEKREGDGGSVLGLLCQGVCGCPLWWVMLGGLTAGFFAS